MRRRAQRVHGLRRHPREPGPLRARRPGPRRPAPENPPVTQAGHLDTPRQLEEYRMLLDRMEAVALEPEKSRDLIHAIARDL
ncbi:MULTISPECIES: Scr1 family TA system antitoxin-like transcriptional regulator [Streptomyces]|uniref:Scr1 family TA system antitoxin-like transcriptional regulator n=1 Tax=Streptomyces TaxID=1883 RepID=UPI00099C5B5A